MTARRRPGHPLDHLSASRAPVHALAAVAPLVLLHAALTLVFEPPVGAAAAGWVMAPFFALGLSLVEAAGLLAAGFLCTGFLLSWRAIRRGTLRPHPLYVLLTWAEGATWGWLLHWAWNGPAADPARAPGLGPGDELALALGAGIYEELVFRVGVFWALRQCFRWVLRSRASGSRRDEPPGSWPATAAAVLLTSALFAAAHHLAGDPFAADAFSFRVVAALYLTALLALRGLGVAVTAHAAYDVAVVVG